MSENDRTGKNAKPTDSTGFLEFSMGHANSPACFLEADRWQIIHNAAGDLDLQYHFPAKVLSPFGSLFGGYTTTYIDLISIWASMTTQEVASPWIATVNMRVDYVAPMFPPGFRALARVLSVSKRDYLVEVRFEDKMGKLQTKGIAALRQKRGVSQDG